jgi:cytochrome c551/c552
MVIRSVVVGLCLVAACAVGSADPERALLDKYCVTCHNQRLKTGGLTLDNIDLSKVPAQAEVWEKVIGKLRSGTMPPAGLPRPDAAS